MADNGQDDLEPFDRTAGGTGEVAHQRAPRTPATPRDNIPNPRSSPSLARRIASARPGASRSITARVPSGVRSRGPNPVPPVVQTRPVKPSVISTSAAATDSTPSAVTPAGPRR